MKIPSRLKWTFSLLLALGLVWFTRVSTVAWFQGKADLRALELGQVPPFADVENPRYYKDGGSIGYRGFHYEVRRVKRKARHDGMDGHMVGYSVKFSLLPLAFFGEEHVQFQQRWQDRPPDAAPPQ